MAATLRNQVYGQVSIKDGRTEFTGDEVLYIFVRDSLRHERSCIELGSKVIRLRRGQSTPIAFECHYDPDRAQMNFQQMLTIPGGVTLAATIERNDEILFINNTDIPLAEHIDIELIKSE